jgi:hypothetical protein
MKMHAGRITITTVGAAGAVLAMAQPAWGATATTAESSLGVDPQAVVQQLQSGAKVAAGVAALVLVGRLLRGQRRRTWGRAQSQLHLGNKLARGTRSLPVLPAPATDDSLPGWLVTGSHTAVRRAWSGSTTGANPVGSMSARTGRPGR